MLFPKKVKYRKSHKGRGAKYSHHPATRRVDLAFGAYGLKALEPIWVTSRQIEAARRAMTHCIKRGGRIWVRIFPDHPVTMKGAEVPMGGGKGAVDHYAAAVRPGMILFEMDGVERAVAQEAFKLAAHKLPIMTRFIEK